MQRSSQDVSDPVQHFDFLTEFDRDRLFCRVPEEFDRDDQREVVAMGLGATLYSPADRPGLAKASVVARSRGVTSSVICLEDAIPDEAVESALINTVEQLREIAGAEAAAPMTFVRVRSPQQIVRLVQELGDAMSAVTGFVLPKFTPDSGSDFLSTAARASEWVGRRLWLMPVVETPEVMARSSRAAFLSDLGTVLDEYRDHVLAVRVGATDLGGSYGLRRPRELTIYDIRLVADAIADIVGELGRPGEGYPITGPVWEYFSSPERLFKPLLRETPFAHSQDRALRARLIAHDFDGLIREAILDRANGLMGKTVIHPSHVPAIHALSVVTHEEYVDAHDVLRSRSLGGGVAASSYRNKMNEGNPHRAWAERTELRARLFGVSRDQVGFVDLLGATVSD